MVQRVRQEALGHRVPRGPVVTGDFREVQDQQDVAERQGTQVDQVERELQVPVDLMGEPGEREPQEQQEGQVPQVCTTCRRLRPVY